ncbi:MAG: hypothetical protein JXM69_13800 [Anaerolineae bacterium]|nr:hypothetical protein [Anaerolineae bacterium]
MPKYPAKSSSQRRFGEGILLALISVSITLILLEALARFLPPPYNVDTGELFACHSTLGWTGKPNYHDVYQDSVFRQELVFNSLGMHDTEHRTDKDPGTFRILMLGDSFVHAIQVSETETAHQLLENSLNENTETGRHVEVISQGVVNWGTNQQLVSYREQGRRFQPDLVLLMFYIGNDFVDNLPGNVLTIDGVNCYAPYFALCNNTLHPAPLIYAPGISGIDNNCSPVRRAMINTLGWFYQHSRLYQQIEPLLVARWPREQFGRNHPLQFAALYLPDQESELEQAYLITQATIAQLQQEVETDGSQFAVALIGPWAAIQLASLSSAEQDIFLKENPTFAKADINRPNQRMADFLSSQRIPFIDLTRPMIETLTHDGTPLYLLGEGHWTVAGNRVAADILAQWLVHSGLLIAHPR